MASVWVEERERGYVVRWRDAYGKHTSPAYGSKGEATAAARALRVKLPAAGRRRRGATRPAAGLTLAQIAAAWAEDQATKKEDRPGRREYLASVVATVTALATRLEWLSPRDASVDAVKRYLLESEGRGRRQLSYLRVVLRWAAAELDQPLDPKLDARLRAPPSKEAKVDLLPIARVEAIRARAAALEQGVLVDCLATYGWRPVTACRLTIGSVDLAAGVIRLPVKHQGTDFMHPLFPFHAEQIARHLAERFDRADAAAPLFLAPEGGPWRVHRGSAVHLGNWYRRNLREPEDGAGNIYQLKRWAITQMDAGAPPWRKRLTLAQIALYTAHRTKAQVLRYLRTNIDEARDAMLEPAAVDTDSARGQEGATDRQVPPEPRDTESPKVLKFPGVAR